MQTCNLETFSRTTALCLASHMTTRFLHNSSSSIYFLWQKFCSDSFIHCSTTRRRHVVCIFFMFLLYSLRYFSRCVSSSLYSHARHLVITMRKSFIALLVVIFVVCFGHFEIHPVNAFGFSPYNIFVCVPQMLLLLLHHINIQIFFLSLFSCGGSFCWSRYYYADASWPA